LVDELEEPLERGMEMGAGAAEERWLWLPYQDVDEDILRSVFSFADPFLENQ